MDVIGLKVKREEIVVDRLECQKLVRSMFLQCKFASFCLSAMVFCLAICHLLQRAVECYLHVEGIFRNSLVWNMDDENSLFHLE